VHRRALLGACAAVALARNGAAKPMPDQVLPLAGGRWWATVRAGSAHAGPARELAVLSAAGATLRHWPLADAAGRGTDAPVRWLNWPARQALVVAPGDLPELWEISLDPHAEDRYDGLVHDFRFGEGVPVPGFLHRRRISLAGPVHGWAVDAAGTLLVVLIAKPRAGVEPLLQGWNLDARRIAVRWPWPAGATPGADPVIDEPAGVLWLPDGRSGLRHRLPLDGLTR
jgi:hypothetical protein